MDYLGLLFEIIFLCFGIYLWMLVRGLAVPKDPEKKAKLDEFRKANGWWLRLLSLALVAVMAINIIMHVRDLMG